MYLSMQKREKAQMLYRYYYYNFIYFVSINSRSYYWSNPCDSICITALPALIILAIILVILIVARLISKLCDERKKCC